MSDTCVLEIVRGLVNYDCFLILCSMSKHLRYIYFDQNTNMNKYLSDMYLQVVIWVGDKSLNVLGLEWQTADVQR